MLPGISRATWRRSPAFVDLPGEGQDRAAGRSNSGDPRASGRAGGRPCFESAGQRDAAAAVVDRRRWLDVRSDHHAADVGAQGRIVSSLTSTATRCPSALARNSMWLYSVEPRKGEEALSPAPRSPSQGRFTTMSFLRSRKTATLADQVVRTGRFRRRATRKPPTTTRLYLELLEDRLVLDGSFGPWGAPVNLDPDALHSVVNSPYGELRPGISKDGLSLYFSSDRPG